MTPRSNDETGGGHFSAAKGFMINVFFPVGLVWAGQMHVTSSSQSEPEKSGPFAIAVPFIPMTSITL